MAGQNTDNFDDTLLDYVNKRIYDNGIDYQGWRLQQRETIE